VARQVHEREDLLRDARALVPRASLRVELNGQACNIFAGFRGASLSIYFGDDPVFHFNARGELRRAFVNDRLIKAERGRLVALERKRSEGETALEGGPLKPKDEAALLEDIRRRLRNVGTALAAGSVDVVGQVPDDGGDAVARLSEWLAVNPNPAVAASPRVG
jgi:hypothetical protein